MANFNAHDGQYANALQTAVYRNRVEVIRRQLGKGADVNTQRGNYYHVNRGVILESRIGAAYIPS